MLWFMSTCYSSSVLLDIPVILNCSVCYVFIFLFNGMEAVGRVRRLWFVGDWRGGLRVNAAEFVAGSFVGLHGEIRELFVVGGEGERIEGLMRLVIWFG